MNYTENQDTIEKELSNIPEGFVFETNQFLTNEGITSKTHSHRIMGGKGKRLTTLIAPGVTLSHFLYLADEITGCNHSNSEECIEINSCRFGRVGWDMKDGQSIYLGPDDFSVNSQTLCADSVMTLPSGFYEGITITINMEEFDSNLPIAFKVQGINAKTLSEKLCPESFFLSMTGTEETRPIFDSFYEYGSLSTARTYIKLLELLLFLYELPNPRQGEKKENMNVGQYQSEQIDVIKQIHDYMLNHIEEKITIEQLSDMFHMNTTTIKQVFKGVYGDSLASHIREHRMEHAAELLTTTDLSIANIATQVGYSSQSKFSENFKEAYGILPLEYRKR